MKKQNLRIWVIGSVLVGGAVLAGGWFAGVQPLLQSAGSAAAAQVAADQENATLQVRLASLETAQRHVGTLRAEAAKAEEAVPSTLDAQAFVNRINVLAAADDVKVAAITPGDPQAYTPPILAPGVAKVDAFTAPSITGANFVAIPMSVQVTATRKAARTFLGHLQRDSRLYLVDGYSLVKDTVDSSYTATTTGYIWALKGSD